MDQLVTRDNVHLLPNRPGVYFFLSDNDHLLYIGKSISLRDRVRSHFYNAKNNKKEERLANQTVKIAWQETVGELGALLLEADLIKKRQPIYNRMLRKARILYGLQMSTETEYYQVSIVRLNDITYAETAFLYGLSRNKSKLQDQLINLVKECQLCGKLTNLEKGKGPCFYFQLKYCQGACTLQETASNYNQRLLSALDKHRIKSWPFPGSIIIEEKSKTSDEKIYHLIDKWCHINTSASRNELETKIIGTSLNFDFDIYKILSQYFLKSIDY